MRERGREEERGGKGERKGGLRGGRRDREKRDGVWKMNVHTFAICFCLCGAVKIIELIEKTGVKLTNQLKNKWKVEEMKENTSRTHEPR